MFYKNCPFCGVKYDENNNDYPNSLQCSSCEKIFYNNPKPTAAGLLMKNNKIILVKRKSEPYKGYWGMPGGFLKYGENPSEGLAREIKEELSVDIDSSKMVDIFNISYPVTETDNLSLIVFVYETNFNNSLDKIKVNDDAEEWALFDKESIPDNIAFPEQKEYLNKYFGLTK